VFSLPLPPETRCRENPDLVCSRGTTWKYGTRVRGQETSAINTKVETLVDKIEKTKRNAKETPTENN
jgi:hypothetical protein